MSNYHLAIDIGASSGRHILSHLEAGRMILEEIHRFPNGMKDSSGSLVWDVDTLFSEIKTGLKKCKALGKFPVSVGIDTWAVDFVLLDDRDERIGDAVAYRDGRTRGMDEAVYDVIPETELYGRNGIQKQIFNTIYQLMAVKCKAPEQLHAAKSMLLLPDYFHFLLTGKKVTEYTNATTTQLVSPVTKDWDYELIRKLGYPEEIFQTIVRPGTVLGHFTEEVRKEIGFDAQVIIPATHDTASAVLAVPSGQEDYVYISSGTWSLMGTELPEAVCSEESRRKNLTSEGGFDYRFRYLKNIMGLWMIQSVKKEIGADLGFDEICQVAARERISSLVNCNDDRFLAPPNMTEEIRLACRETGQQVPDGIAQSAAVVYRSLANCYAQTLTELEEMTGKRYAKIHIVGGGSQASWLNELTAKASGVPVCAGPGEATAAGNLAAQMIALGEFQNLWEARECIRRSYPVQVFEP